MKVTNKQEAWNKVNEIFPTDYEQDLGSSDRAGYPIYRSTAEGHYYDYICDLGNRLEVNLDSSHLATVNIWIEEPAKAEDNVQAGVEAMHAAKALGQTIITVDNGCEFQDFEGIEMSHRRKGKRTIVFFCHPYSAYERGSNENMNRLIRRFFPQRHQL